MNHWEVVLTYAGSVLFLAVLLSIYALYLRWEDGKHSEEILQRWDYFIATLNSNNPQDMEKYLEKYKAQNH